jgi:hypothetical protein
MRNLPHWIFKFERSTGIAPMSHLLSMPYAASGTASAILLIRYVLLESRIEKIKSKNCVSPTCYTIVDIKN